MGQKVTVPYSINPLSAKKYYLPRGFFPSDYVLPNTNNALPHIIVGDEAIRLPTNIMKPFNKAAAASDPSKAIFNYRLGSFYCIFNYRLSRARRVSEYAFGLLSQVFRVFYT